MALWATAERTAWAERLHTATVQLEAADLYRVGYWLAWAESTVAMI